MKKKLQPFMLFLLSFSSIGLCDEALTEFSPKLLDERNNQLKELNLRNFRASAIYKSTKKLSEFANKNTKVKMTLKALSIEAKELGIYNSASMWFGGGSPSNSYLNTLPFDLDKQYRYCILTFKGKQQGMHSSLLLKLKWTHSDSLENESRHSEMLRITTDFYTRKGFGVEIVRCWFNPWNNEGEFQVEDERKKKQNPITYWTTAVGKKPDAIHKKHLENKSKGKE